MPENNAQVIHSLCTEQADSFAAAVDLLPESYQKAPERILAACLIAHALDLNPAAVMFGKHMKTAPAPKQAAEKPAKPENQQKTDVADTDVADTWPQEYDGVWTDIAGTIFDKHQHAFNKTSKMPSIKADGTFRNARHGAKPKAKNKTSAAPAKTEAPVEHDNEQALIDSNQVLGSFKNHVENASTGERLAEIGSQIELMGFTPSELTLVRRWIAERTEAIEQDATA